MLVATEDELSESVARKLLREVGFGGPATFVGRKGNGFLKANLKKYRDTARRIPVVVFTDLDAKRCAPSLVDEWLGADRAFGKFCLRVAVRETEAWVMADRKGFAEFMGISEAKIARDTEAIPDPKRRLLELAHGARRSLRLGLLPAVGAAAIQGLDYNRLLGEFVTDVWSVAEAERSNRSLNRAMDNLRKISIAN